MYPVSTVCVQYAVMCVPLSVCRRCVSCDGEVCAPPRRAGRAPPPAGVLLSEQAMHGARSTVCVVCEKAISKGRDMGVTTTYLHGSRISLHTVFSVLTSQYQPFQSKERSTCACPRVSPGMTNRSFVVVVASKASLCAATPAPLEQAV